MSNTTAVDRMGLSSKVKGVLAGVFSVGLLLMLTLASVPTAEAQSGEGFGAGMNRLHAYMRSQIPHANGRVAVEYNVTIAWKAKNSSQEYNLTFPVTIFFNNRAYSHYDVDGNGPSFSRIAEWLRDWNYVNGHVRQVRTRAW